MYGLLLQNMAEYVQNKFGDNMWKKVQIGVFKIVIFSLGKKVREQMNLETDSFPSNEVTLQSTELEQNIDTHGADCYLGRLTQRPNLVRWGRPV